MKVFPFSSHSIDILLKGVSMYPQVYSSVPLQHKQSPITCPSCGFLIPYVNGSTASFSWPPSHRRHGPRTHRGRRSTDKPTRKLCHKVQTLFRRTPFRQTLFKPVKNLPKVRTLFRVGKYLPKGQSLFKVVK
jgi:hypothetical protein